MLYKDKINDFLSLLLVNSYKNIKDIHGATSGYTITAATRILPCVHQPHISTPIYKP